MGTLKYSVRQLMAKDIIDVTSGTLLNVASTWLFDGSTQGLTGILPSEAQGFIPKQTIKAFAGDVIVIDGVDKGGEVSGIDLIGLPVINEDGVLIGKVIDMAIDREGRLLEFLLSGGLVMAKMSKPAVLSVLTISRIGTDALICQIDSDTFGFSPADERLYKEALHRKDDKEEDKSRQKSEEFINKIGEQWNEIGEKISDRVKNVNYDEMVNDLNRLTTKINRQLGDFFDQVIERTSRQRYDRDVEAVLNDLAGQTVYRPIVNEYGQVIIMPGQEITSDVIKQVLRADRITELYRLARPLSEGGSNDHETSR